MTWRWIFLAVCGFGAGVLISAGVFTVLLAVGLVPRFAGKTHTASKIFLYEEMVVLGTLCGNVSSVFERVFEVGGRVENWIYDRSAELLGGVWQLGGYFFQILFGFFAGIFVGCLAMAIAEMLDSIPIFTRRIGFRHGLGFMVLATALGKMAGSIYYFLKGYFEIVM